MSIAVTYNKKILVVIRNIFFQPTCNHQHKIVLAERHIEHGIISAYLRLFNVVVVTALTFIIAIISNWCFCTLLDGKGKLIDIAMVGASALVPYIVVKLIEIVLSHFVTTSLSSFFYYAVTLAVIWGFFIVFAGLQNIHEYSALMTIVSLLLTVLGIMIVIFLLLVVVQLYQQIVVFISTIALEIKYR